MNQKLKEFMVCLSGVFAAIASVTYQVGQEQLRDLEQKNQVERFEVFKLNEKIEAKNAEIEELNAYLELSPVEQYMHDIAKASQQNNYVILGDTDHRSMDVRSFLYNKDIVQGAAQNNFKYIAIEEETSWQPLIDAFVEGRISRRSLIAVREVILMGDVEQSRYLSDKNQKIDNENFADFIEEAKKYGIKVLAADGKEGNSIRVKNTASAEGRRFLAFAKFLDINPEIFSDRKNFVLDYLTEQALESNKEFALFNEAAEKKFLQCQSKVDKLPPEYDANGVPIKTICGKMVIPFEADPEKIREQYAEDEWVIDASKEQPSYRFFPKIYLDWRNSYIAQTEEYMEFDADDGKPAFLERRLREDTKLAERIKRLTKGEKTLIIYGAGHVDSDHYNLAQALGNAPVIRIFEAQGGGIVVGSAIPKGQAKTDTSVGPNVPSPS